LTRFLQFFQLLLPFIDICVFPDEKMKLTRMM